MKVWNSWNIFLNATQHTDKWIWIFLGIVLAVCVVSLIYAIFLLWWVMRQDEGPKEMMDVAIPIRQGANGFLKTQYIAIGIFAACFAVVLFVIYIFLPTPSPKVKPIFMSIITTVAFLLGAFCSGFSGWFGMWVAVRTNVRCSSAARFSANTAIQIAFRGGAFSGMLIVTLSLLGVGAVYALLHGIYGTVNLGTIPNMIVGYGFGASFVALFAQLGGGIYTKAADVGADLVGKCNRQIPEDDPRNPAVIADLVGDNVGDCAGRGADLFESTAAENIGAMIIGGSVAQYLQDDRAIAGYILFPLIVRAAGLIASAVGILCVFIREKRVNQYGGANYGTTQINTPLVDSESQGSTLKSEDPMFSLVRAYLITTVICIGFMFLVSYLCLYDSKFPGAWWQLALSGVIGILTSLCFVGITEYYTDYKWRPVKEVAESSQTGHATNIIAGMAVGMESTCVPVLTIGIALVSAYWLGATSGIVNERGERVAGYLGTAIACMGMLMSVAFVLAMDTFGPIADNAGGIVEMSNQPEDVRERTDRLDAVGNTTKALTKGYAVGSAGLATFLLFTSLIDTAKKLSGVNILAVDLSIPEVFVGGILGGMLVFLFSSWCIKAVGNAAQKVITEVERQFDERPGILENREKPDYNRCVAIVTRAALFQMIRPSLLVVLSPIVVGLLFRGIGAATTLKGFHNIAGIQALGALLMVATMTGVLVGLFLNNAGGAWDNAKKYIEMGHFGGKKSEAHLASITGDTVGDPCKDTAGPSIHVLVKLISNVALVLAPIFIAPKKK
eukprot:gnl/Trimastix_PCT/308.p1 GENE.gnl/Trimastix_PCT/308~~gnl/Trimastix_PCT/308.p1  ORF type:complete len:785 (-),score=267.37 gnl/Trimastix_PCT/308:72-2426(-)